jgi:hypothetical protein
MSDKGFLLDKEEREWHRTVRKRMGELLILNPDMDEQDAWDQAWIDCGGLILLPDDDEEDK